MSWQTASRNAFLQQLVRNKYELNGNFPPHWNHFLHHISIIYSEIDRVVDIGCGVGVYYWLLHKYYCGLKYIGYDYASEAIQIARSTWMSNDFYLRDYRNLHSREFEERDVIVANALCDVCADGDKCLEKLLSLQVDFVIVQRVRITDKPNYYTNYQAYGEIDTVEFYHNKEELYQTIKDCGYMIKDKKYYSNKILDLLLQCQH